MTKRGGKVSVPGSNNICDRKYVQIYRRGYCQLSLLLVSKMLVVKREVWVYMVNVIGLDGQMIS